MANPELKRSTPTQQQAPSAYRAPADDRVYRWLVVGMLWLVCMFNYADRQAIFSVFTLLQSEMGLSDVQLGIVGSAFMWMYALFLPLAGLVGDRVNRKFLIIAGLTFWSVVTLLTGFAQEYWHLAACRALEGLGEAFYMPASMSLISDYHGPQTRSRAMALHQSSVYAGTVVGGSVAGLLADHFGWRSGFYLFGSLGVVLAGWLLLALREPERKTEIAADEYRRREGLLKSLGEVICNPMVLLLTAVFIGANFVAVIFLTWLPTYLKREYDMSLTAAGFNATGWLQVSSVIGVLAGGWLADRWVKSSPNGRLRVQVIGLVCGCPLIFLTGWTNTVPLLIAALVGFGFFKGLYDANIWAALYDFVRPERRATALGFMNSLGWIGGGTAPVAVAVAAQRFGMGATLSGTSLIYLLFGLVLASPGVAKRTAQKPQQAHPQENKE